MDTPHDHEDGWPDYGAISSHLIEKHDGWHPSRVHGTPVGQLVAQHRRLHDPEREEPPVTMPGGR
jgi:hypothetical protein